MTSSTETPIIKHDPQQKLKEEISSLKDDILHLNSEIRSLKNEKEDIEEIPIKYDDEEKQKEYEDAVRLGWRWADKYENSLPLRILFAVIIGAIVGFIFHYIF